MDTEDLCLALLLGYMLFVINYDRLNTARYKLAKKFEER